jgi:hypothetical protein
MDILQEKDPQVQQKPAWRCWERLGRAVPPTPTEREVHGRLWVALLIALEMPFVATSCHRT